MWAILLPVDYRTSLVVFSQLKYFNNLQIGCLALSLIAVKFVTCTATIMILVLDHVIIPT
jgi:hypothetical protein